MRKFLAWLWRATLFLITAISVVDLTFAGEDFKLGLGKIMNLNRDAAFAVILFLVLVHIVWQAVHELPARFNPVKKRALKRLAPSILGQFEWGRHFTMGLYQPDPSGERERELADLRSELYALDCEYPNAKPGDLGWGWWIGYLEALLPFAEKGDLTAARRLVRSGQSPCDDAGENPDDHLDANR